MYPVKKKMKEAITRSDRARAQKTQIIEWLCSGHGLTVTQRGFLKTSLQRIGRADLFLLHSVIFNLLEKKNKQVPPLEDGGG